MFKNVKFCPLFFIIWLVIQVNGSDNPQLNVKNMSYEEKKFFVPDLEDLQKG